MARNEMHQRIRVKFEIQRFSCDPSEITAALDLKPTQTWLKGDDTMPYLNRKKDHNWKGAKYNYWGIESGVSSSEDVETHLHALIKKIHPKLAQIQSLDSTYHKRIWISAHYYTDNNPGLSLESQLLQELAELKIDMDMESWCPNLSDKDADEYMKKTEY